MTKRVGKAEMIEAVESAIFLCSKNENKKLKCRYPDHDPFDCDECEDEVRAAIIRLIRASQEGKK